MPSNALKEISNNSNKPRKELSQALRIQITTALDWGHSVREICEKYSVSRSAVYYTKKRQLVRQNNASLPRSGRPKKLSDREERRLLRYIRLNPKATFKKISTDIQCPVGRTTIKSILKEYNIAHWVAKKRPNLTPEVAAKRLAWAKDHRWSHKQWEQVIWSDECSVERGSGKDRVWVFATPEQKWDKEYIQTYNKSKDISVMVWAAIWGTGRSNLYLLDRDFDSKKMGYSANSYLEVLDNNLPDIYAKPGNSELIFMQDNAPIHTAKKVKSWLEEKSFQVLDWPPYSPDLNPIEHLWFHLKKHVNEVCPGIEAIKGGEKRVRECMAPVLVQAWQVIPQEIIDQVIKSMPARIEAVITAEGWHTRF